MRTIGVGLIGTGYMGKCHALAWTGVHAVFDDTPIVRRVMLCEVEEGLARRKADEFGFESSTDDWRALIADPGVEVVSITTPNALHAPMRRRAPPAASPYSAIITSRARPSASSTS
jgi:predicted dehydrogenase